MWCVTDKILIQDHNYECKVLIDSKKKKKRYVM